MKIYNLKNAVFFLLIILIGCSFLFYNQNNDSSDDDYYQEAANYYAEQNYSKTLRLLDKTVHNSDFTAYMRCKSYYHLKKYSEAVSSCSNELRNTFLNEIRKIYLALSFYRSGIYDKTAATASGIKGNDPYINFLKLKIQADAFYQLQNYQNAADLYLNAIEKTWLMNNHRIRKEFLNNDFKEDIFNNLFYSYFTLNRFSDCIAVFNKYFSYVQKADNRHRILLLTHHLVRTNRMKIDNNTRYYLGQGLYYAGKKEIAENYFNELISSPDKSIIKLKAYFYRALIYKDNEVSFNQYLNEMLKVFNSSDQSLYQYARAYYLTGRKDKAFEHYMKLIGKGKDMKAVKQAYMDIINNYPEMKEEDYEELIKKFYLSFKSDRTGSELYFKKGLDKLNKNDETGAVQIFNDLKNNNYYGYNTLYFLGKIYYMKKKYKEAFTSFFEIINKNNLDFYFIKSMEYLKLLYSTYIKDDILREMERYKNDGLKYNFFLFLLTGKERYREEVINLIDRKNNIKKLLFGDDRINLRNNILFRDYVIFKLNGLHNEAYLLYKSLEQEYRASVDFYSGMLVYSVRENWFDNSLRFRGYIIYELRLSPYLLCFDNGYLKYYYPYHYEELIDEVIKKKEIAADKNLIFSLIREESRFDRLAFSPADAVGLFQIIPSTGESIKKKLSLETDDTLYNLNVNVLFGIYYLNRLLNKNDTENIIYALCAYNAGYSRVVQWKKKYKYNNTYPEIFIEFIPYTETRNYVKNIFTSYFLYSSME